MKLYRTRQFAELAGITVRTLHHYDRLGLLKPKGRSGAGYRLYCERDLLRLEQVLVLKYLGLSLAQIGRALDGKSVSVQATLRLQRWALEAKRNHLESAIRAIDEAGRLLQPGHPPDWTALHNIIEVISMDNNTNWAEQYYSAEARAKVEERKKLWNPELQAKVSQDWAELIGDVEASLGEDPAGPKGQALAARWRELVRGFTGGDPEIQAGLNKMYSDAQNWPGEMKKPYSDDVDRFIRRAMSGSGIHG